MKPNWIRWSVVVVWMAFIFYLSSIPAYQLPKGPEYVPVIVHFLEFSVLGVLLLGAVNDGLRRPIHLASPAAAFLVAVFYGIFDELHQLYVPGRVTDMFDLLIDSIGALTAVVLASLWNARAQRRKRPSS